MPALLSEHALTLGVRGKPWGPFSGTELLEVTQLGHHWLLFMLSSEVLVPGHPGCLHSGALTSATYRLDSKQC